MGKCYLLTFYNSKIRPKIAEVRLCQAIRRPDHYPDGTLSIEDRDNQPAHPCAAPLFARVGFAPG
jgi:hypothetical protein